MAVLRVVLQLPSCNHFWTTLNDHPPCVGQPWNPPGIRWESGSFNRFMNWFIIGFMSRLIVLCHGPVHRPPRDVIHRHLNFFVAHVIHDDLHALSPRRQRWWPMLPLAVWFLEAAPASIEWYQTIRRFFSIVETTYPPIPLVHELGKQINDSPRHDPRQQYSGLE